MDGKTIREWRKGRGLTQAKLAELCGVSNTAVSAWETGRDKPSGAALKTLEGLMSGHDTAVIPLSDFDAKMLDELVARTGAKSREDYLTMLLREWIEKNG